MSYVGMKIELLGIECFPSSLIKSSFSSLNMSAHPIVLCIMAHNGVHMKRVKCISS